MQNNIELICDFLNYIEKIMGLFIGRGQEDGQGSCNWFRENGTITC